MLSRRVIAYYGLIRASESLPATYEFAARAAAPKEIGFGWESRGSPIYSAGLCSRAASHTPVARRVRWTVASSSVLAFTLVSRARRPHWKFRGCRVHSYHQELLRPASWLALLSRTFTFELSLAGSPRANVEYHYVDKQSISTTGLSPASPTALWAAGHQFLSTPISFLRPALPPSPRRPRPDHSTRPSGEGSGAPWLRSSTRLTCRLFHVPPSRMG